MISREEFSILCVDMRGGSLTEFLGIRDRLIRKIFKPITLDKDIEEAIEWFEKLLNLPLDEQNIEEVRNKYSIFKHTLKNAYLPKLSDDVEDIIKWIEDVFKVNKLFTYSQYKDLKEKHFNKLKQSFLAQASEIKRLNNKIWNIQELLDLTPKDIRDIATYTYEEIKQIIGGKE